MPLGPRSVAREGALDNLSPALCAGIVAAKAAHRKMSANLCSGRLRGRTSLDALIPRAERGARIGERAFARGRYSGNAASGGKHRRMCHHTLM